MVKPCQEQQQIQHHCWRRTSPGHCTSYEHPKWSGHTFWGPKSTSTISKQLNHEISDLKLDVHEHHKQNKDSHWEQIPHISQWQPSLDYKCAFQEASWVLPIHLWSSTQDCTSARDLQTEIKHIIEKNFNIMVSYMVSQSLHSGLDPNREKTQMQTDHQ